MIDTSPLKRPRTGRAYPSGPWIKPEKARGGWLLSARRRRPSRFGRRGLALLAALMAPLAWAEPDSYPVLMSDSETATAGYYRLSWNLPGGSLPVFELQEARDAAFSQVDTVYRGRDAAKVMSGRANGYYWYRIRAVRGDGFTSWSAPLKVTVAHHSLSRALGFFAVGGIVFAATLVVVVTGARRGEGNE